LLKGKEKDAELQAQLVRVESKLGGLYWQMGHQDRAVALYRKTLAQLDRLMKAHPGNRLLRHLKGGMHGDMGVSLSEDHRHDEAIKELLLAEKELEPLAKGPHATDEDRNTLARAWRNLSYCYIGKNQPHKARELVHKARKVWRELARRYPDDREYQEALGQ